MTIYAGKLRHRANLQEPATAVDSFGERIDDWRDLGRIYCHIEPLSGEELVYAQQVAALATHRITTRWGLAINPHMRILWRLYRSVRIFQIVNVSNKDEKNRELVLLCKESDVESPSEEDT